VGVDLNPTQGGGTTKSHNLVTSLYIRPYLMKHRLPEIGRTWCRHYASRSDIGLSIYWNIF